MTPFPTQLNKSSSHGTMLDVRRQRSRVFSEQTEPTTIVTGGVLSISRLVSEVLESEMGGSLPAV